MFKKIINRLTSHISNYVNRTKIKKLRNTPAVFSEKKVLFWLTGGLPGLYDIEAPIELALYLRGYKSHAVICDGTYRACVKREVIDKKIIELWNDDCRECLSSCKKKLNNFGVEYSYIGDYLNQSEISRLKIISENTKWSDLEDFSYFGVKLGGPIKESVIRYYQGDSSNINNLIVQEYVFSALINFSASQKAILTSSYRNFICSHGVYIDWGVALLVALEYKLISVVWFSAHTLGHYFFQHAKCIDGQIRFNNNLKFIPNSIDSESKKLFYKEKVRKYLDERYLLGKSSDVFVSELFKLNKDFDTILFSKNKPVWCIFLHINWDSVASFDDMLFDNLDEWTRETFLYIRGITSVNWLIKIHPHEETYHGFGETESILKKLCPVFPDHIKLMPAGIRLSNIKLYKYISGAVTVFGTSGLEAALFGKPVILAGNPYYSDFNFTLNPETKLEYFNLLKNAINIKQLTSDQVCNAEKIAYHYYYGAQIRHPLIEAKNINGQMAWVVKYDCLELLKPNRDDSIELIINGIINGDPFVYKGIIHCI